MNKKNRRYITKGVILLLAALILQVCARWIPGFATWYAHHIYPVLVTIIGGFFGLFPFSVVELGLYIILLSIIVAVIRYIRKPLHLICRGFRMMAVILFVYTLNCGINYLAMPFSEYARLELDLYTEEELKELCQYLVIKVNETATAERYADHRLEWLQEGVNAMQKAGEDFPSLSGFYPRPKPVLISSILSVQQLAGIYAPFTIEANFNQEMTDYNIPHTICHELSHLKGFMREDEANFIGYLACLASDNQSFQYSGYLTGWIYAGNALAKVDPQAYIELHQCLSQEVTDDLVENHQFWSQYDGKIAEVSTQWNDTYLKINRQSDGVQSYGHMVDLMLAYYKNTAYQTQ
ncbi:MAG: DUF3810 domain-containing protein [Lachnospiraceae bacterium]